MTLAYPGHAQGWEHPVSTFTWELGASSQVSVWRVGVWISEGPRAQALFYPALQDEAIFFYLCLLVKIIIVNILIAQFKGFPPPQWWLNTYWLQPLLAGDSNLGKVMLSSVSLGICLFSSVNLKRRLNLQSLFVLEYLFSEAQCFIHVCKWWVWTASVEQLRAQPCSGCLFQVLLL